MNTSWSTRLKFDILSPRTDGTDVPFPPGDMSRRVLFFGMAALLGLSIAAGRTLYTERDEPDVAIEAVDERVMDWSKLDAGAESYYRFEPGSTPEVQATIRHAVETGRAVRVRGRGHSTNTSSLPRPDELLIITRKLNHYRTLDSRTVVFGAGKTLYGIRLWLGQHGYGLPVYNMGEVGPSLGGYISAGGIGVGSREHGGFWENVEWVGLVDGQGRYHRIGRDDERFPWLFGSMGQLGVIVEAALRIVPVQGRPQRSLPREGHVPAWGEKQPAQWEQYLQTFDSYHLYSVAVFVPDSMVRRVTAELHDFFRPYESVFWLRRTLTLPIRFRDLNPPLLYPEQESFTAVGIEFVPRETAHAEMALTVDEAFGEFVRERGYRRYIQMELTRDPVALAQYFGSEVWDAFYGMKQEHDPHGLFGQGLFQGQ